LTGSIDGPYWAQVLSQRLGYTVRNGEAYTSPGCTLTSDCVFPGGVIPQRAWSKPAINILPYIPVGNIDPVNGIFSDNSQKNRTDDSKAGQRVDFNNEKTGNWSWYYHYDDSTLGINPSGPPGFPQTVPPLYFNNFSIGVPTLTTGQPNNTWMLTDGFSKVSGNHTLKFGGEFRYLQINERNVASPNGTFNFDGSVTGVDAADYELGAVSAVGSAFQQYSMQFLDSRTRYGGAYAQDSWKVRPNLTLNLGLRWEVSMPWYDTQGKIETIVPGQQSTQFPTAPLGWVVPGDAGIPSTLAPTHYNNWAPRLGLAYSPDFNDGILRKVFGGAGKTSIRAAYGIYYTSIEDLNLFYEVGDPPFGNNWQSPNGVLFEEPYRTRTDGASQGQKFPFIFPTPGSPANATLNFSQYEPISYAPGYDIHNRMPYAEHYNFSIQRELSKSTVLTLAYVATQGHKLISQTDANPGNTAFCLQLNAEGAVDLNTGLSNPACGPGGEQDVYQLRNGTKVNGTRTALGPAFGANNTYTRNSSNSNYNSFQASVERKAADMTFLAAYTFGKALDDASTFGDLMNFTNYRLSRSLSSFDVTNNFVASYNWALPFDRTFGNLPKRLTQGWNISGITRFSSGFPIHIRQSRGDLSLTGSSSTDEPNVVGPVVIQNPHLAGPNGANTYFLPSAFTSDVLGYFGDANRQFFHGPGIINTDFGMSKRIPITESIAVELRGEFFNIFNHTNFNNPSGNFSSSLFGVVTGAGAPRIGQVSAKFYW